MLHLLFRRLCEGTQRNHENLYEDKFHCFTVHFNSLNFTQQLMHFYVQGGSNMTGTDLYVNKPHCAAAVRP